MELSSLAELKYFFEKVDNKYIDLDKPISNFNIRLVLQKLGYILNEMNILDLFGILDANNDYSWYIRGVYSKSLADAYYELDSNKDIINHIIETKEENIKVGTDEGIAFLSKLKSDFKINDFDKYMNILELYSSIIFLRNMNRLDKEGIISVLISEKPYLNHLITERNKIFSSMSILS